MLTDFWLVLSLSLLLLPLLCCQQAIVDKRRGEVISKDANRPEAADTAVEQLLFHIFFRGGFSIHMSEEQAAAAAEAAVEEFYNQHPAAAQEIEQLFPTSTARHELLMGVMALWN